MYNTRHLAGRFHLNNLRSLSFQERGARRKLLLYKVLYRAGEFGAVGRASWFIIIYHAHQRFRHLSKTIMILTTALNRTLPD